MPHTVLLFFLNKLVCRLFCVVATIEHYLTRYVTKLLTSTNISAAPLALRFCLSHQHVLHFDHWGIVIWLLGIVCAVCTSPRKQARRNMAATAPTPFYSAIKNNIVNYLFEPPENRKNISCNVIPDRNNNGSIDLQTEMKFYYMVLYYKGQPAVND